MCCLSYICVYLPVTCVFLINFSFMVFFLSLAILCILCFIDLIIDHHAHPAFSKFFPTNCCVSILYIFYISLSPPLLILPVYPSFFTHFHSFSLIICSLPCSHETTFPVSYLFFFNRRIEQTLFTHTPYFSLFYSYLSIKKSLLCVTHYIPSWLNGP